MRFMSCWVGKDQVSDVFDRAVRSPSQTLSCRHLQPLHHRGPVEEEASSKRARRRSLRHPLPTVVVLRGSAGFSQTTKRASEILNIDDERSAYLG